MVVLAKMVFHFEGIACLKAAEATEKFEAVLLVAHHSQAVGDCDCRPHLVGRFLLGQILCFFFVDDQLYVGLLVRVGRQEVVLKLRGGSSVKPAAVALESLDLQTIFKKKLFLQHLGQIHTLERVFSIDKYLLSTK